MFSPVFSSPGQNVDLKAKSGTNKPAGELTRIRVRPDNFGQPADSGRPGLEMWPPPESIDYLGFTICPGEFPSPEILSYVLSPQVYIIWEEFIMSVPQSEAAPNKSRSVCDLLRRTFFQRPPDHPRTKHKGTLAVLELGHPPSRLQDLAPWILTRSFSSQVSAA